MSEGLVVCPSGLAGEVRGLKTREANLLADRASVKQGTMWDTLLANCWLKTTEFGPYSPDATGKLLWSKVLVGDRFYTLLRIRAATYGEDYPFRLSCSEGVCREQFEWTIKLNELSTKPYSRESLEAFRAGRHLPVEMDGNTYQVRLVTGADEARAARIFRQQRTYLVLTALLTRIASIDGVEEKDRSKFLEDLDLATASRLIDHLDGVDGGVETNIEVECPHCGTVQEVRLPFGASFFLPRTKASQ